MIFLAAPLAMETNVAKIRELDRTPRTYLPQHIETCKRAWPTPCTAIYGRAEPWRRLAIAAP
jgi:hypothetical protein